MQASLGHSSSSSSSHKGKKEGSSKGTTPVGSEDNSACTPQQPVALSPPVLPERLPLQEVPILTSPHKKSHKSKTTPRTGAVASPSSAENPPVATPKSSQVKSGRKQSKKAHSKRSKAQSGNDGAGSFRRSGSTHSLDDTVSSSSIGESDRNSFRFLDEFEENTSTVKANATPRSFRSPPPNGGASLRRGSYDSNEARKPSLSFSSSEALSDAILSIDSCTSGDSTPKVLLTRQDPNAS